MVVAVVAVACCAAHACGSASGCTARGEHSQGVEVTREGVGCQRRGVAALPDGGEMGAAHSGGCR